MSIPIALTIAGSDSGGGAGIQADIKTFSALGVYGASVITAVTAQNTRAVTAIAEMAPAIVSAQISAVFDDLEVDAVKIGMLANAEIIHAVAEGIRRYRPRHVVLDPVMVAKSGDHLLRAEAVEAMVTTLMPLATLITPNLPEAIVLGDWTQGADEAAMVGLGRALLDKGAQAVLLKGGHLQTADAVDMLIVGTQSTRFSAKRICSNNTHGTGCTLSAAIAAYLALGRPLAEAVQEAKSYLSGAIAEADTLSVGSGHGPVHHFYRMWR
ncbi:hydroxymethylpyrimidine/phosphomethylpyrimidine kinase [Rhodoligotrophos appendicifer]|uniref:bifunctional hydroxymethylpyrimidine kinase/phosphomethylpyrimidine kinase n=1 Tax=Rhodoligotrophos appendicifer TaxID=987056 RepID=UPI00118527F9|nr:bifunctional hydroxymethylpyrimidine kinase/phosphomethylpyrimidine kinase [Rhodoligotrophos appendicifer]